MTVSQIDQLKAEIASLEQEALKELKTRREALIAEIASVDEQIAALLGQSRTNPVARKRAGKRQTTSTSERDAETPVADLTNNGHHQNNDALDRQNENASPEACSQRSDDQRVQPQNDPHVVSADCPVFSPRIPVLGKNPHPIGFSYPLGASAMSEALAGLPMFDQFTLHYSNRTPIFTMTPPLKGFPMLRITYTNYPVYESRGSAHRFQGGERWSIEVLPTPFDHREFIQKVILEQAVPLLRDWLTGPELPGIEIRRMAKACWYAVEAGLVKWIDEDEARLVTA